MKLTTYLSTCLVAAALVACGGGGGNPGTVPGGTSNPGSVANSATATDFIFELDKTTIVNSGTDKAVLAVTTLDSNRNTLPKVPVSVAVDANGVLASISGGSTDASGRLTADVMIGGDKSNRILNVSITVNGVTKVASVVVTGSQISVTPIPSTPAPGQSVTLNLSTTDYLGAPIQNVDLVLSGTAGATGTVKTDASGIRTATFNAPATAGSYTVVVTGLGVSTTKSIVVAPPSGGVVPVATGTISSASVSPQPSSILTNVPGNTTNRSKLSAKFLAAGNTGIQNMRVRFEIVAPALGGGESISTGDATVYTDVSGTAEADYISGTRSSPTNGVLVRACYSPSDFVSASDCPQSVTSNLTVAGSPLSISITDDNVLNKGLGGIAYVKKFLIQVNDASGVAVKDAIVVASVDITHYGKGLVWGVPYRSVQIPTIRDLHSDYLPPAPLPANYVQSLQPSGSPPSATENIWCVNEDWNRNGFLDAGEDINGDGVIQPRKAEIVVSYVNGNKTDVNGQTLVQITYGQTMAGWLAYTIRATTTVIGSEGDASRSYVTNAAKPDVDQGNGSFLTLPFGSGACNAPS